MTSWHSVIGLGRICISKIVCSDHQHQQVKHKQLQTSKFGQSLSWVSWGHLSRCRIRSPCLKFNSASVCLGSRFLAPPQMDAFNKRPSIPRDLHYDRVSTCSETRYGMASRGAGGWCWCCWCRWWQWYWWWWYRWWRWLGGQSLRRTARLTLHVWAPVGDLRPVLKRILTLNIAGDWWMEYRDRILLYVVCVFWRARACMNLCVCGGNRCGGLTIGGDIDGTSPADRIRSLLHRSAFAAVWVNDARDGEQACRPVDNIRRWGQWREGHVWGPVDNIGGMGRRGRRRTRHRHHGLAYTTVLPLLCRAL